MLREKIDKLIVAPETTQLSMGFDERLPPATERDKGTARSEAVDPGGIRYHSAESDVQARAAGFRGKDDTDTDVVQ